MHIKGLDLSFLVWAHLIDVVMKYRVALYQYYIMPMNVY